MYSTFSHPSRFWLEGAKGRGHLLTQVERRSQFTVLALMKDKQARTLNQASKRAFGKHKGLPLHTLTVDKGKEFAGHAQLAKRLNVDVYFARPYHAWERGLNEQVNGLLRQFFPKGMDRSKVSHRYVAKVERLLNTRPRKKLNYRTPDEVLRRRRTVALQK